ncbi:MAG: hypothetical protein LRY73_07920 [Bacillus sp. (in: Bacteria)]|nr:hypothetical protein [Bacillus sp. (in: firmicutes)]
MKKSSSYEKIENEINAGWTVQDVRRIISVTTTKTEFLSEVRKQDADVF